MTPEITALLEKRLTKASQAIDLQEVGRVVSVGDGIARARYVPGSALPSGILSCADSLPQPKSRLHTE